MATRDITNPGLALSIKAVMVSVALVLGIVMVAAYLANVGQLTEVYGFVGVVLLAQAALYALL